MAAAIELSPANVLLLDEPDSHLHSSLQRRVARLLAEQAGPGRQIVIATHAPDLIDEVPLESLRWIDRSDANAKRCDDIGKTLVRLGAVSQSQAIQSLGSDVVIYFEDKPDRNVLTALLSRCGKAALAVRARPALLKGHGDIKHLPGGLRVVKALLPMKVAVAAIRDPDYTQLDPKSSALEDEDVLVITLPCKELENLLFVSPQTVVNAAKKALEARASVTGQAVAPPTAEEVERKIAEFSSNDDLREAVEDQWLFRWCEAKGGLTDPGDLTAARKEFEARWNDLNWRRRCCPGKRLLSYIRRWLQADPWKVSLTTTQLFDSFQPDADLLGLFDQLEAYVIRMTKESE